MAQDKASKKMVERHCKKYPPSEYQVGDKVVFKIMTTGKKIRRKGKGFDIREAVVLEKRGSRYQLEYEKNGNKVNNWFPVNDITSETREIGRK